MAKSALSIQTFHVGVPVQVPAVLLLGQLPAPERGAKADPSVWAPASVWETPVGVPGHSRNDPADGRSVVFSIALSKN